MTMIIARNHGGVMGGEALVVPHRAPATANQGQRSFDHPSEGQHLEADPVRRRSAR
jgi:hypothetical protein